MPWLDLDPNVERRDVGDARIDLAQKIGDELSDILVLLDEMRRIIITLGGLQNLIEALAEPGDGDDAFDEEMRVQLARRGLTLET